MAEINQSIIDQEASITQASIQKQTRRLDQWCRFLSDMDIEYEWFDEYDRKPRKKSVCVREHMLTKSLWQDRQRGSQRRDYQS